MLEHRQINGFDGKCRRFQMFYFERYCKYYTYMKNTLIKDILQENSLLDEFSIEPPISSSLDSLMFKIKLVDAVKILA